MNYSEFVKYLNLFGILLAICFGSNASQAADQEVKRVVLLFGAWTLSPWELNFTKEFIGELTSIESQHIAVSNYFLDLALRPENQQKNVEKLEAYILEHNVDLVVGVLPGSNQFLLNNDGSLLNSIPKIMVLPGKKVSDEARRDKNATIIYSAARSAIGSILDDILHFHPEINTLEIVSGTGENDLPYLEMVRDIASSRRDLPTLNYTVGATIEELNQKLFTLPGDRVVLFLGLVTDRFGRESPGLIETLAPKMEVPAYGFFDSLLGFGIVGGRLTSVAAYTEHTGSSVVRILNGESPLEIQIPENVTRHVYDWRELDQLGIDIALIPETAQIAFMPPSAWDLFRDSIISIVNFVILLVALIVTLAVFLLRTRRDRKVIEAREKLLVESERRYRLLAENSVDVVWVWDQKLNKFTYASPAATRLTDFTPEEILEGSREDIMTPESLVRYREALKNGESVFEIEMYCRDGSTVWCETNFQFIHDDQGEVIGQIGATRDISDRKKAEQERHSLEDHLKQKQKFEALGTLAGGIAHDFNNILSAVFGYIELIRLGPNRDTELNKFVEGISTASDRAKELVDHILTFSRQNRLNDAAIDIPALLEESAELLKVSLSKTVNLQLQIEKADGSVRGDAGQIQQVIVNLATNAAESMDNREGNILLSLQEQNFESARKFLYGELDAGQYYLLKVEDDGRGMDTEQINKVFDPFYTSKKIGGGLGLAIVHGIVLDHGGAIDVVSQPGAGSIVSVYLPIRSGETASEKIDPIDEQPILKAGVKKRKVLLVDDEPQILDAISRMLEFIGFECVAYSDPLKALDFVNDHGENLDLILSDYSMPVMSGIELLERCKARFPDLSFIISTGYSEFMSTAESDGIRADAFLAKPYKLKSLREAIDSLLPLEASLSTGTRD